MVKHKVAWEMDFSLRLNGLRSSAKVFERVMIVRQVAMGLEVVAMVYSEKQLEYEKDLIADHLMVDMGKDIVVMDRGIKILGESGVVEFRFPAKPKSYVVVDEAFEYTQMGIDWAKQNEDKTVIRWGEEWGEK